MLERLAYSPTQHVHFDVRLGCDGHFANTNRCFEQQHPGNAPQRLDQSAKEIGGRSIKSSLTDNAAGILEFVGEDVRQYPVTEEENERAEEADDGEERKSLVEVPEKMGTLNVQGEREKEGQTSIDEDESAQRALVAKEWEAIDQVRFAFAGSILETPPLPNPRQCQPPYAAC